MRLLRARSVALVLATAGVVVASTLGHAAPASAAVAVDSYAEFANAVNGCTGTLSSPTEIVLAGDVSEPFGVVTMSCSIRLDLAGFELRTATIAVSSGARLTVWSSTDTSADYDDFVDFDDLGDFDVVDDYADDAGRLTAISLVPSRAGIELDGSQLFVLSGVVEAQSAGSVSSDRGAAAIGGAADANGGYVRVEGGMVRATASDAGDGGGAGIGSGSCGAWGGAFEQTGGVVWATGAEGGAGVGGGSYSDGSQVYVFGGSLRAAGSGSGAAIGHGTAGLSSSCTPPIPFAATVLTSITGGDVTATSPGGPGIGGSLGADPADISIGGGRVAVVSGSQYVALGGTEARIAISGGWVHVAPVESVIYGTAAVGGPRASLELSGGTLVANGRTLGVGIGGGPNSSGIDVTIGAGATALVTGGINTVGGGTSFSGGPIIGFGSLELAGDLVLPFGQLRIAADADPARPEVTILSSGRILGVDLALDPGADPTNGALVTGDGVVENRGVIALAAANVADTITIAEHDFTVTFDRVASADETVRVFAPHLDAGFRALPMPPSAGWNLLADGTGATFTSTTPLSADLTVYEPRAPGGLPGDSSGGGGSAEGGGTSGAVPGGGRGPSLPDPSLPDPGESPAPSATAPADGGDDLAEGAAGPPASPTVGDPLGSGRPVGEGSVGGGPLVPVVVGGAGLLIALAVLVVLLARRRTGPRLTS